MLPMRGSFLLTLLPLPILLLTIIGCTGGGGNGGNGNKVDLSAGKPELRALHLKGHALISQHRFEDAEKELTT